LCNRKYILFAFLVSGCGYGDLFIYEIIMIYLLLLLFVEIASLAPVELINPAPLFMFTGPYERTELSIRVDHRFDIGAHELVVFEPWRPGDFSMNNRITTYDYYWFQLCYSGPNIPYRTELNRTKDKAKIPVACWLCDLDEDGDVDQDDFGIFQLTLEETSSWGDADQDGDIDCDDICFVEECLQNEPYYMPGSICETADLNENFQINETDMGLAAQAWKKNGRNRAHEARVNFCADCMSGPSGPECLKECDLDGDSDVDQEDFGLLQTRGGCDE